MTDVDILKQTVVYIVKVKYKNEILKDHFVHIVGVFKDIKTATRMVNYIHDSCIGDPFAVGILKDFVVASASMEPFILDDITYWFTKYFVKEYEETGYEK